jgi:hypothetical protein
MFKHHTDFETVRLYKKGDHNKKSQILKYFWKKYHPLIIHTVKHYYRHERFDLDFEDCIQECFFCFPKALKNVKLTKIHDKQLFSFGQYLKKYLMGYTSALMTKSNKDYYSRDNFVVDNIPDIDKMIYIPNVLISKDNIELDFEYKEIYSGDLKDRLTTFYFDHCNSSQKKILRLCVDRQVSSVHHNSNYWVKRASKTNKTITSQYFYKQINTIKRMFIRYMKQHGYYSNESLKFSGLSKFI